MSRDDDAAARRMEDAAVTALAQLMADKGIYEDVMQHADAAGTRQQIEDSIDRHAARQRSAGKPGW